MRRYDLHILERKLQATCFLCWLQLLYNCQAVSSKCVACIENKFLSVSDCPSKPCPRYPVRVVAAINHHVYAYSCTYTTGTGAGIDTW